MCDIILMTKIKKALNMKNTIKKPIIYGIGATLLFSSFLSSNINDASSFTQPAFAVMDDDSSQSKNKTNTKLSTPKTKIHTFDEPVVSKIEKVAENDNVKKLLKSDIIAFETRVIEDTMLPVGVEIIEQTGINGQKDFYSATELVLGIDGTQTPAEIKWEEETKPVDQIVRKGTNNTVISGVHPRVIEKEEKLAAERAAAAQKAQEAYADTQSQSAPQSAPKWSGGGNKESWLRDAGIAESDWGYVDYIVNRESSWNPNAVNASSGASGLVQALPCSKVPGSCFNPVDNLRWANGYAKDRYGSWQGAYNFWTSNHWW